MITANTKPVFGRRQYKPALKKMWKQCFPDDSNDFIDFYFNKIYRCRETLVYLSDSVPVASLQMLPYKLTTGDKTFPAVYLSGVMTRQDFRSRGYAGALLRRSFEIMRRRGVGYALLIPQEDSLFRFYEKFGFITCNSSKPEAALEIDVKSSSIFPDSPESAGIMPWKGMIKRINEELPEIKSLHINIFVVANESSGSFP